MATGKSRMTLPLKSSTALALCLATPALAQPVEDAYGDDVLLLDPIVVQSRDDYGNAADRGTSVYVADAELERARMGDLKDLFAGLANVSVGGAIPVAQKIFVNGVDMLNLAVTVDGVSQNNRIFHHASANAFDPGLMKFVRVDPGVAAADAGPFALAGGVVMETVDAGDVLDPGDSFGGNTRLSFTDNGETWQTATTLAGRFDGFEYLGYLKRAEGTDYEAGGDGAVMTGTGANLWAGLGKVAFETQDGARFEFSAQRMIDDEIRNGRANFGPTGWLQRYDTERTILAFNYAANVGEGMWDPSVNIGFSETAIDVYSIYESEGTTDTKSATFKNTFHLAGLGTVDAGLDYRDQTGHYVGVDDFGDPTGPYTEQSENIGLFAQARLEPTERLSLSGGLRYDWQDFTGNTGSGTEYSRSFSGLSGNLSLAFDVTDNLSLRGGYSNVFGGLAIEDNYTYDSAFDYDALEASRSENFVVGVDWASGGLTLGAEVFKTRITDMRLHDDLVPNGGFTFESEGFNLSGTYGWASGFARMTFSHSEVTRDGTHPGSYYLLDYGAPLGDVIALEIQQEIQQWDLMVGGSLDVALDYDSGAAGTQKIPGYTVLDVFAEYSPASMPNLTVRAEVNNLFDEKFADRATYGVDYPEGGSYATLYEPGRAVSLTAVLEF
ncbi:TonB-dependent receptor domain-containing protein [Aliiroseovarius sp.]|uniref:TonB-dependent receptor plug domain-containing protein n=1 Tax=Aliiroseovarius sp. TaxID=1872442 RepID=UPI003BAC34BF